ncbi:hypothetical protein THASP1DRAFT_21604 [Thamnocephalis sphaerospora]|uniref:Uncharacterized protein n=1 Tax=Thamnocephalis sphaerospora TaxID=78915 RepID=A0A4P9XWJ9_9FUNG|nr:hypothetical protein THASP1DRAFT_21604 [Thamnocephalis sphaerospora]|eukprot:RKP10733.1 hypothetical protein THASP1DRAFT_21604 [Thamnocephalis sphaerospora]
MRFSSQFCIATLAGLALVGPFAEAAPQMPGASTKSATKVGPAVLNVINNDMFELHPEFKIKVPYGTQPSISRNAQGLAEHIVITNDKKRAVREVEVDYWADEGLVLVNFSKYSPDGLAFQGSKQLAVRFSSLDGLPEYYEIFNEDGTKMQLTVDYDEHGENGEMYIKHEFGHSAGTLKDTKPWNMDSIERAMVLPKNHHLCHGSLLAYVERLRTCMSCLQKLWHERFTLQFPQSDDKEREWLRHCRRVYQGRAHRKEAASGTPTLHSKVQLDWFDVYSQLASNRTPHFTSRHAPFALVT